MILYFSGCCLDTIAVKSTKQISPFFDVAGDGIRAGLNSLTAKLNADRSESDSDGLEALCFVKSNSRSRAADVSYSERLVTINKPFASVATN